MLKFLKCVNARLARPVVAAFGTMGCVYLFFLIGLLAMLDRNPEFMAFAALGGLLQLVALPLIMLAIKQHHRESEHRAIADHDLLLVELEELRGVHEELKGQLARLKYIEQLVTHLAHQKRMVPW